MYLKRNVYKNLLDWKQQNRLTLEVSGTRQAGKTFIINKFADEQFARKLYINMLENSGNEFLACLDQATRWEPGQDRPQKPLHTAFLLYDNTFIDDPDTVVIIDEIQESPRIYNLVREFTRSFQCRFIVTGSYLGRILNPEFKLSAGDLTSLRIETLTFEEFADAFGEGELFLQTGLYGTSAPAAYERLKELYGLYCQTGGYPAVVTRYLETGSLQKIGRASCRERV